MRKVGGNGLNLGNDGSIQNLDVIISKLDEIERRLSRIRSQGMGIGAGIGVALGVAGSPSAASGSSVRGGVPIVGFGTEQLQTSMIGMARQSLSDVYADGSPYKISGHILGFNPVADNILLNSRNTLRSAWNAQSSWEQFSSSPAFQRAQQGYAGPSYAQTLANIGQRDFQQHRENVLGFAGGAAYVASDFGRAYTQSVISGQPNPLGYGQAWGGAVGLGAGLAIMGMGAGFSTAGPIGAGVGLLAGTTINALQAPYVAFRESSARLAPTAAVAGASPQAFAGAAQGLEVGFKTLRLNQQTDAGAILETFGMYSGADVASREDHEKQLSSLSAAYLQRGIVKTPQELKKEIFQDPVYGYAGSGAIAELRNKAMGAWASSGKNLVDLTQNVGVESTIAYMRQKGIQGPKAIAAGFAQLATQGHDTEGARLDATMSRAAYEVSGYSDLSVRQRDPQYQAMIGGLRGEAAGVRAELHTIEAMPGGSDSNLAKAKKARLAEIDAQIAREAQQRSTRILGETQNDIGIRHANTSIGAATTQTYGTGADFDRLGKAMLRDLAADDKDLRARLADPNLSYEAKQGIRQQIKTNEATRRTIPAQMIGAGWRRDMSGLEAGAAWIGANVNEAVAFGSLNDINAAATGAIDQQDAIYRRAMAVANNPKASAEDRAAAMTTMATARNNSLSIRTGTRDVALSRLSQEAGIAQSGAGNSLLKASTLGSGNDVRSASAGMVSALNEERSQLQYQLNAGGLTVEQSNRVKLRMSQIERETFQTQQGGIDAAYAKDDLGFSTRYEAVQSKRRIAQYLPYSPSNMMGLTLSVAKEAMGQISVLSSREAELEAQGNLSPERKYDIRRQQNALREDWAAALGSLANGQENKLAAYSAGTPSFFRRYNSLNMAALAVKGTPVMDFGAADGKQAHEQAAWFAQVAGGSVSSMPFSRTSDINGHGAEIAGLLRELVSLAKHGSSPVKSSGRPGEAAGYAAATLHDRTLNQRKLWNGAN